MRNTSVMNDYLEVEHGMRCLKAAWDGSPVGKKMQASLEACIPGSYERLVREFNGWAPTMRQDTFITCVSEHQASEDEHGRLSMWRAYGGRTGVALVFNPAVMFGDADVLGVYAHPVSYLSSSQFAARFSKLADSIQENCEFIKGLGADALHNAIFAALRWGALCTKHPGFEEEREWRVVACPAMYPSKYLKRDVEIVRGVPQPVLKLELRDHPEEGVNGLAVASMLERIIIGPCETPVVVRRAFHLTLQTLGIAKPEERIAVSGIPLRQAT